MTISCRGGHDPVTVARYGVGMTDMTATIRAAVLARRPVDARERDSIARFVELFDTLERPFDEHAHKVHVTSSAILVSDDRRRVLLHKHKRLGLWLQPGGHIEPGESPADAALRESIEEIGVPARHQSPGGMFVHVDVHPGPKGHTHLDLRYVVRSPRAVPAPAAGESAQVRWCAWAEAEAMADAGLIGALRATKSLLGLA